MKQFVFAVEVLIKDDKELLLVRDPQSGRIAKVCDSPAELATFLEETITNFKNQTENGK